MSTYFDLETLLETLDSPAIMKLYQEKKSEMEVGTGSTHNHQAWLGGYLHHITETMNIAHQLYDRLNNLRPLPFTLKDALIVMFLHDLEKPWKTKAMTKKARRDFRDQMILSYNIFLTTEQWNALEYVEGEHDYTPKLRRMGELAAFCHCCDVLSARLWHDFGTGKHW